MPTRSTAPHCVLERSSFDDRVVAEWRAMGSAVRVVVTGTGAVAERAVELAFERVTELEATWSRFVPTSDVSRLNAANGHEIPVSADTVRLVNGMKFAHVATDGAFDPTLVVPLVRLGYDHSLDDPLVRTELGTDLDNRGSIDRVQFREVAGRWHMKSPVGTAIDPGGIGKGLAADIVIETIVGEAADRPVEGALVSIGGDVAVAGLAPEGRGWFVDVLDPSKASTTSTVRLERGGIATSSVELRRLSGGASHHLVDPRTLESVATGVRGATVIAGTGAWAEAFTKYLVMHGRAALDHLDRLGLAAQIVDGRGVVGNRRWNDFEVASWN